MKALGLALLALVVAVGRLRDASTDGQPVAGLSSSKHDFSAESWTGGDRCIACHFQKREEFPAEAPLWNPSAAFNRTFGDAIRDRPGDRSSLPGNGTLVCLRCHDGTMAKDMFGSLATTPAVNKRHPGPATSAHGGTNHPVGIEYPQFDRGYRPMNLILSEGKVVLPDGRIECTSCHDPHNELGTTDMLTKSNERSALCLTCHIK